MACKKLIMMQCVVALFVIGSTVIAHAQVFDVATQQHGATSLQPPSTESCYFCKKTNISSSRTNDILWDTSKGIYWAYSPSSNFSDLTALLTSKGYTMDENNQGVLSVNLNQYKVVVICIGSAWYASYSSAEVKALESYVKAGGGLLILGENSTSPVSNIDPLTTAFGVKCGLNTIYPLNLRITNLTSHPIFTNIYEVFMRAAGKISVTLPSSPIAWTSIMESVISAADVGSGRTVILGDMNCFDNAFIKECDNLLLSENIFDWLGKTGNSTLTSDTTAISASTGGIANFTLDAGSGYANRNYLIIGGVSGTSPGIPFPNGAVLPINWDIFTGIVIDYLNTILFTNFLGVLDSSGKSTAVFNMPPVSGIVGLKFYYAFGLAKPLDFASNSVEIEVIP